MVRTTRRAAAAAGLLVAATAAAGAVPAQAFSPLAGPGGSVHAHAVPTSLTSTAPAAFGVGGVLTVPLTPGVDRAGDRLVALLRGPGTGFRTATLGYVAADKAYALAVRGWTAAGTPDPTFNGGKPVVQRNAVYQADGAAVAQHLGGLLSDAQGRTYIEGTYHDDLFHQSSVRRLTATGAPDTGYTVKVPTSEPAPLPEESGIEGLYAHAWTVLPDGRTRMCLDGTDAQRRYLVGYAADGTVEAAFGTGQAPGWAVLPETMTCGPLAADSTGRLLMATGERVHRFTAAGAVDATYGTAGSVTVAGSSGISTVVAAADGSAYLGGATPGSAATAKPWLAHLTAGGALDAAFGTSGVRVVGLPGRALTGLAVLGSRLYVSVSVPQSALSPSRVNAVLRLRAGTGALDIAWGKAGTMTLPGHRGTGPGPLAVVAATATRVLVPYTAVRGATANGGYVRTVTVR